MSKSKTKVSKDERAQLAALGLNPDAPAFGAVPASESKKRQPVLAPEGVDPHTMAVTDIVFDPALLDEFPSLEGDGLAAASRHVFALYKSPGRNKDRNSLLHREIGLFIQRVRRSRKDGVPHVKEQVRRTGKQRDLLALLAEHGITSVEDLKTMLGESE